MTGLLQSFGVIDKASALPIYQQIKGLIERKIHAGTWSTGQKLPSENDLVSALGVSRMTINRALRELSHEGLVNRVHGIGTFIADKPRHASLIELKDIALEITLSGRRHSSRVLTLETRIAPAEIQQQMNPGVAPELYYLCAVHYQDALPIQFESRYVNPVLVPDFIDQDFSKKTSTAHLLSHIQPDEMEHIVRAVLPHSQVRKSLLVEADEPCLQLTRRTWLKGRVVTHVTLTYPGSRYDLGAKYATNNYQLRS